MDDETMEVFRTGDSVFCDIHRSLDRVDFSPFGSDAHRLHHRTDNRLLDPFVPNRFA